MSANCLTDLTVGCELFYKEVHGLERLGLIEIPDGKNSRPIDWGHGMKKIYFDSFARGLMEININ